MPPTDTKQKILEAARACFNTAGVASVRLQHLADEAGISLGNLTYHFRNKDAIVLACWERIEAHHRQLLAEFRVLPLFEDIERLLRSLFALQQEYAFFYQDTLDLLRGYPDLQEPYRRQVTWQVQQLEQALAFNQARGALQASVADPHQAQLLARHFWLTAHTWMYGCAVLGRPNHIYTDFQEDMWQLLRPYFTELGLTEFRQTIDLMSKKGPTFENLF